MFKLLPFQIGVWENPNSDICEEDLENFGSKVPDKYRRHRTWQWILSLPDHYTPVPENDLKAVREALADSSDDSLDFNDHGSNNSKEDFNYPEFQADVPEAIDQAIQQ
ncbi:hypothetical protein GCK72_024761 [Caenorhabditis remanei]|uniref:Uncharacterized protein n=1 Tax=Caenorhabditis remanei TaxID=31234 RepID=A0A6A5G0Y3_CAERE|nr:hypothetical protein GCK72_024761 [Caenorhabditis remanei]KAF1748294.1 hypothetical protein GCK72_024761 [Caenorhabditis remanei]